MIKRKFSFDKYEGKNFCLMVNTWLQNIKKSYVKVFQKYKDQKLEGRGSQFITNSQIKVDRLINLKTGEIIQFSHRYL